jgi:hypothetical protein
MLAGIRVSFGIPEASRGDGQLEGSPTRYMYLVDRKDFLPVNKVHVPRQPEGLPSSRQGTCTSSTGREPFQPSRYMYLAGWKGTYLAGWKGTLPAGPSPAL